MRRAGEHARPAGPLRPRRRLVGIVTRRDALRTVAWGDHTAGEVRRRRGLPPVEPPRLVPGREQEQRAWTDR